MKFGDVFKIALHNLWHNKSRTVLTVIIVTIVSSLIMGHCLYTESDGRQQDRIRNAGHYL